VTLDVTTGLLTFPATVSCNTFQTSNSSLTFLANLSVKNSRISYSAQAPFLSGTVAGDFLANGMSSSFEINKVGGAIYGSRASVLSLSGSGANGTISIWAERQ
jgi:hypothetical protein